MEVIRSRQDVVKSHPAQGSKKDQIVAKTCDVDELSPLQLKRMYQVFSKYYSHHSEVQFIDDLMEKSAVILLLDKINQSIQGFSTILKFHSSDKAMPYIGLYSGDTVLEAEYWGSPALGKEFLKYLWKQKIKSPFRPVYWFLISKGYKTYLLMANNFDEHFPRYELETPQQHKKIMQGFYKNKFSQSYQPGSGLIVPQTSSCRLKADVACIEEDLLKNPRIQFFQEKNPGWQQGHELCCIAKMTYFMPFKYSLKKLMKKKRKK